MATVRFQQRTLEWNSGESLLECLERHGVDIPSSCRSGACHSCLVKVTEGPISPIAQLGLKETWKAKSLCLACVSTEPADVTVAPSDTSVQVAAVVVDKQRLGRDVVRLKLQPVGAFPFRAGQFVNVTRPDGLTRSYSIASLEPDGVVELHVRVVPQGRMSEWVRDTLEVGHQLSVRGPTGDCHYVEGRPDQPLLLVGTGTGLAPLVGIARDALESKHRGSITLVHGGRAPEDLYLDLELRKLAKKHPQLRYVPALSGDAVPGVEKGRVDAVVGAQFQSLSGFRVFLCGSPPMVKDLRALAYKLGAGLDDIHADGFIAAPPPKPTEVKLPVLPGEPAKPKPLTLKPAVPTLQKVRFGVQAAVFAGFLTQGLLYYLAGFTPVGSLLPFMAYDSLGHLVVSSTLVVWATLFALVFVFGRFACGWLCPLGFVQDLGERTLKRLKVRLRRPVRQSNVARVVTSSVVLGHFVVLPILSTPVKVWQLDWLFREPWLLGFPFRAGLFALDLVLVFVVLGLVLPWFFGPRPYCKLVCETGYLFDLTSRFSFGRIRRNEGFERDTCLSCQRCTNVCPQGINVFEEVHLFDRVVSSSCISCLQCVGTCPNDTIVYSLKKKAADTGRVSGYLAALSTAAPDLPRYALTSVGVGAGAWLGFVVLPPSYFHTYALFAALGGLVGFLAWRAATALVGERLQTVFGKAHSQVERERHQRIVPLSPEERLASKQSRPRGWWKGAAVAASVVVLSVGAAVAIANHVPARLSTLEELKVPDPAAREAEDTFYLGVPTEASTERTQATYAGVRDVLEGELAKHVRVVRGDTYGALAVALERGRIDAAFLPGASTWALLQRTQLGVDVLAQVQHHGKTTYAGSLLARPGVGLEGGGLIGARVAFVQPDSLSGYLAPMRWLEEHGVKPSDLGEQVFAGTHLKALSLLEGGRVDVAAVYDSAISDGSGAWVVLARFDGLPNSLLVSRPGLSEAKRTALLESLGRIWSEPRHAAVRESLAAGAAMHGLVPASVDGVHDVGRWIR